MNKLNINNVVLGGSDPYKKSFFYYKGSMPTPPCEE